MEPIEILSEPERRRRRTAQEKIAIVQETLEAGASVSAVSRRHGVNANQVFGWRKQYQEGSLAAVKAGRDRGAGIRTRRSHQGNQGTAATTREEDDGGRNPEGSRGTGPLKKPSMGN
ncbi:transposase-like protein [Paraburkholderia sp. JPY681]|nr:transposase-like protein [Paraburkholderia atlantica]